jgi:YbbR domain-containing protein
MVMVGEVPAKVTFTAIGPLEEQRKINADDLKAYVDLSESSRDGRYRVRLETTGEYQVEWQPSNLRIPIRLEEETTKRVNVEVEAIGEFKLKDYRYDGANSDPSYITVKGAKSLVDRVQKARAYLNLTDLESNNTQMAQLELLDDKETPIGNVAMSTDMVTVRAFIAPRPPRRALLIQPVWAGTPPFGFTVADYEVTPAQVNIEGPADVLANLSVINTKPINIDGMNQTATVPVELDLPQGIRLAKPEIVTIKVFIKSTGTPPPTTTGG